MDRQTDAPWTEPAGALQARLAISIPLFLISYSKAGRGMNSIPACESHYAGPLSPPVWINTPSSVELPDQTASASEDDRGWAKGLDPPAKAATNAYARTNAVVTTTNHDLAHGCTRPVGGLPSWIRAQHLRLGLNCRGPLPAPSCPDLISHPKLRDLPRCMQVIFYDVCVAWLLTNYRLCVCVCVCVSHAPVVSLSPVAKRVIAVSQRKTY